AAERRQLALGHHQHRRARLDGGGGEIVPVHGLALDGEKGIAGLQGAGVYGNTVHAGRHLPERASAHGFDQRISGPEKAHRAISFSAARTSSWSENGKVSDPMVWPSSCPLPAT